MSLAFMAIMFLLIWPGRKLGWALSRFLYPSSTSVAVVLLTAWGGGVAIGVGLLDWNMKPNLVAKVIFGFLEGLYLACPNFGLVDGAAALLLSSQESRRHKLIYQYPQAVFAVAILVIFRLNSLYPK